MTHHNEDMDEAWKFRLERQRYQDAAQRAQYDRTERRIMALLWAIVMVLIVALVVLAVVAIRAPQSLRSLATAEPVIVEVWR